MCALAPPVCQGCRCELARGDGGVIPLRGYSFKVNLCINRHIRPNLCQFINSSPTVSPPLVCYWLTCELHILAVRLACPPCVAFSRFPHIPMLLLRGRAAGGMVTVEGTGISSQQLLIPARKMEWQRRYVWTWKRPDKCSRTKWPEVNVLTKQLAHFNFEPLWHERMREASFVLCVERSSSQMLLDLIDCNDVVSLMTAVAQ